LIKANPIKKANKNSSKLAKIGISPCKFEKMDKDNRNNKTIKYFLKTK
tara:strand:+ start:287 stop:430 length:144 start_codon:yes stop_codon:yes gene_type:complete